jgi:hypothetical protein
MIQLPKLNINYIILILQNLHYVQLNNKMLLTLQRSQRHSLPLPLLLLLPYTLARLGPQKKAYLVVFAPHLELPDQSGS